MRVESLSEIVQQAEEAADETYWRNRALEVIQTILNIYQDGVFFTTHSLEKICRSEAPTYATNIEPGLAAIFAAYPSRFADDPAFSVGLYRLGHLRTLIDDLLT